MSASDQDTIVAIATAPGKGGIGVVRLSGKQAHSIAQTITGKREAFKPRHAVFSSFLDVENQVIDEGLVLYFPGPNSFTGEDVVELQGHGGPVVLDQLVHRCLQLGARQAGAGEFSLRAFLNDKMDLTQAEAIADLIDATSAASARAAVSSLQGRFSAEVNALVEALIQLRIYVEAAIDFPEEEIDFLSDGHVSSSLDDILQHLKTLLQNANQGRLLQEGIKVVLAGKPNAGKSSLLNALAGFESAIVTDIAGTTRDVLREKIVLGGLTLNLVDTAGLRHSNDPVEQEGIRRARAEMAQADLLLLLVDSTTITDDELKPETLLDDSDDIALIQKLPTLIVLNKQDLVEKPALKNLPSNVVPVSAKTGFGLADLKTRIEKTVGFDQVQEGQYSARRRHLRALEQALSALQKGKQQLEQHRAGELLAEDLREAQKALEEITGVFNADDLLGRIFSSFCIGK